MSTVRFGAIETLAPAPAGKAYITGVLNYHALSLDLKFTEKKLPFQAYYLNKDVFRVDLPPTGTRKNGFWVRPDRAIDVGGTWFFSKRLGKSVFQDMREIKRKFDALIPNKPVLNSNLPKLEALPEEKKTYWIF